MMPTDIASVLNLQQIIALLSYVALLLMCIAWTIRFKKFILYMVPPLTVAIHGLVFYASYFVTQTPGAIAEQIAWSPFLRIHSTLTFVLLMILMWDKISLRERAAKADVALREVAQKIADDLYAKRMNGDG